MAYGPNHHNPVNYFSIGERKHNKTGVLTEINTTEQIECTLTETVH